MQVTVVGREPELGTIADDLQRVDEGPTVLALSGEPGIGKTTVWAAGVERARDLGFTVLSCRPTAAEVRLSYAGLDDLLAGVAADSFVGLPRPQHRALDAALLRGTEEVAPDPRAVAAGLRSVLEGLARSGSVLVAIDDVQWLDEPSLRVVEFAVRRCSGPVATLTARRVDDGEHVGAELCPRDPERQRRMRLGPLSLGVLHHVLKQQTGRTLPRHVLVRVTEVSGGNPFFALELARSLDGEAPTVARLPDSLQSLVRHRLDALAPAVREMLLVASALGTPRVELVKRALERADSGVPKSAAAGELIGTAEDAGFGQLIGTAEDADFEQLIGSAEDADFEQLIGSAEDADFGQPIGTAEDADFEQLIGSAEDAGVVELSGGVVRFTHPLLAAGVYGGASATARRSLHRRLSGLVDDVEERARHLALAAIGPDPEVVAALDAAAAQARRRGAPSAAAELLGLAMGLGAHDPARRIHAAQDHFHAGDPGTARTLLVDAIAELEQGGLRAQALALLGTIRFEVDGDADAIGRLEQALAEATGDPPLRSSIASELAFVAFNSGRGRDCLPYAWTAVEEAERAGDDGLLAEALAGAVIVRFLLGDGTDDELLARALALEDPDRRSGAKAWPTVVAGLVYWWTHRLDEAQAAFAAAWQRCLDQGTENELWFVSFGSVHAACAAGDVAAAERYVKELVEYARISKNDPSRLVTWAMLCAYQSQLWAWMGRVDEARAAAGEARALLSRGATVTWAMLPLMALGMAELSVGDYEAAVEPLTTATATLRSRGFGEPAVVTALPDAAEALIALGRLDEAEPLVEWLDASGRRSDRVWAQAVGARCRALLWAASGRPGEAEAAFEQALAAHDRLPWLRYDQARTLLVLGQLQRRRNQRRAAQASLTEAARFFDEVGALQWARNARAELGRLGLRVGSSDELTPTEQHVAELTASGLTNREVAAALFVSPKTVEAHLGRVYRKLDIRSRAELGRLMAERDRPPDPSPS